MGPKFCGVKMLPPGPHLVSYNAASGGGAELAPTTSFFVHAPARSVIVRRWDAGAELLAELEEDEVPSPCWQEHQVCVEQSVRLCLQPITIKRLGANRDPLLAARQSGTLLGYGASISTLGWRRTTWPRTRSGARCLST